MKDSTFQKYKLVVDEWFVNGFNLKSNVNKVDKEKCYVYILINPIDCRPFYIGKGKNNRCKSHVKEVQNDKVVNIAKTYIIQDLLDNGMEPIIYIIKTGMNDEEAYSLENYLINQYKDKITNIQSGRLSDIEKASLMAKIELKKLKPYSELLQENRPQLHLDIYKSNVEILREFV